MKFFSNLCCEWTVSCGNWPTLLRLPDPFWCPVDPLLDTIVVTNPLSHGRAVLQVCSNFTSVALVSTRTYIFAYHK